MPASRGPDQASPCDRFDDVLADVLDGTAAPEIVDHLVDCDRCRDIRHEAGRGRSLVLEAGADYRPPADLVGSLFLRVDARYAPPPTNPTDVVVPPQSTTRSFHPPAASVPHPASHPPPPAPIPSVPSLQPNALPRKDRAPSPRLFYGIAATLGAAAVILLVVLARRPPSTASEAFQGSIGKVVQARRDGGSEQALEVCSPGKAKDKAKEKDGACRPAKSGDPIARGERLRTDARTRAKVDLSDGSAIVLDRDTEIELVGDDARTARLVRGIVSCDIAHFEPKGAAAPPPNARFLLPHASVEVVGTAFVLTASEDMSLVEVSRGEVRLGAKDEKARGEAGSGISVRAGQEGRVLAGKAPVVSSVGTSEESALGLDLGEDPAANASGPDPSSLPRGIGELKAKKPGETKERDRAVRLARHEVKVRIAGTMARTEVDETFTNDSDDELEGIYRMPLPPDARIERLALEVNGKLEEGAFVARDRAKAIWGGVIHHAAPQAKVESDIVWVPGPWRDPALLEWQRGNRFDLRIFPIPAHGARRVVLAYTQTLPRHGASRRYVYPLAYDPKGSTVIGDFAVDLRVVGHDPAFGVKPRGYPLTRSHEDSGDRLAMTGRDFVPAGDLAVEYALPSDASEVTTWTYAPNAATEPYVAFTLRPDLGAPPEGAENRDRLYVVALDASRSMFGERWTRASKATAAFVAGLDRRDHVLVLACDTGCQAVGGDEAQMHAMIPGGPAAEELRRLLAAREPEGAHDPSSTVRIAIDRGHDVASKLFANRAKKLHLVYVGDGGVSAGTTRADRISRIVDSAASRAEATVTTIGIGADADGAVLDAIARGGRGVGVRDGGQDAGLLARAALAATRGTALERPTVTLPAGMTAVSPAVLPTLAEGSELVVVARASAGTTAVRGNVVLEGSVGGERWQRSYPLDVPIATGAANAFVPRLYAGLRIADLEQTKGDGAKDEIVRLSRDHAIASRHTSLLVLESEAMFKAFGVARGQARTAWTGEAVAEATSSSAPAAPSVEAKAVRRHKPMMLRSDTPPVSTACDPPFAIDASGSRKYKAECLGGGSSSRDETAKALEALQSAQLESSGSRASSSSLPFTFDSNGLVPMRRIWIRKGTLVATTATTTAGSEARLAAAEKAAGEEPNSRTKTSALVRALAATRQLDLASDRLRAWLGRDPLDADALALRAEISGRSGDRELELRALGSVVDVRPDDAHAQLALANALEALGLEERACAHRITLAESSAKDLDNLARVRRCTTRLGFAFLGDALTLERTDEERKKVATLKLNDEIRGDVQLTASWDVPLDLDIALVDAEGRRFSWTSTPNGTGEATVRDAASNGGERVGFVNLPSGTYSVEVTAARAATSPVTGDVRGAVEAKLMGKTVRIPFVANGPRTAVGTLTVSRQAQLVPL
jgi:hypothetical protein